MQVFVLDPNEGAIRGTLITHGDETCIVELDGIEQSVQSCIVFTTRHEAVKANLPTMSDTTPAPRGRRPTFGAPNSARLRGNLTSTPTFYRGRNGSEFASAKIAVDRTRYNATTGTYEKTGETDFYWLTFVGKAALAAVEKFAKGDLVTVRGFLEMRVRGESFYPTLVTNEAKLEIRSRAADRTPAEREVYKTY